MSKHALLLSVLMSALAAPAAAGSDAPLGKVPLTGPLTPVPPTAQTHIPRYEPGCRWRTERYHHPTEGWISRRVRVCR
ncbi:MAG: hypothetical protein BroJett030_10780 [Alphaproteobacteria bacterium]|nr:MAG: hypothetical protein BroJett030_10780 [Alphaproteobacteria bacterium]